MDKAKELESAFIKHFTEHHYPVTETVLKGTQLTVSFYSEFSSQMIKGTMKTDVSNERNMVFDFIFAYENEIRLSILPSLNGMNQINNQLAFIKFFIDSDNKLLSNCSFVSSLSADQQEYMCKEILEHIDSCTYEMIESYRQIETLEMTGKEFGSVLAKQVTSFLNSIGSNNKKRDRS